MQAQVVAGCRELVAALDHAVQKEDVNRITESVKDCLVGLIEDGGIELPAELCRPAADSYARRLVHRNVDQGYTVVAMVWGPSQATALHDHSGLWCVEGVIQGRIRVDQYDLVERSGDLFRFTLQDSVEAGVGSAGCLIPPFEYHTIANALADEPSITLHVYGGEMEACSIFEPRHDDWYGAQLRQLAYSA